MSEQNSTRQTEIKKTVGLLYQNFRSNLVTAIASAAVTLLASGGFWIWSTGGTFYQLPGQVRALEAAITARTDHVDLILEQQQELNDQQKELNILQQTNNEQTSKQLEEIKLELRSINEYLRENNK